MVACKKFFLVTAAFALGLGLVTSSCTSAKKTEPELGKLSESRIALVEIEGEDTARRVAEVALINEIQRRGTFELVSKEDVQKARQRPDTDPSDWRAIARATGAQAALRIKVIRFEATVESGYSKDVVEDSELNAEQGRKGAKSSRLVKIKRLTGNVAYDVEFALGLEKAGTTDSRHAVTKAEGTEEQPEAVAAARLTPRLRFLESLTGQAFQKFFDRYE